MKADVIDVFVAVIAEHDDADAARRIEADESAIAACSAVVPYDLPDRPGEDVPGESDLEVRIISGLPLAMSLVHGTRERCGRGIEIGDKKRGQVGGGRAQRASAGEGRQVPVGNHVPFAVVTGGEPGAQHGREGNRSLGHPEWRKNPARHELLVACACLESERMAQQAHAEVRVLVGRAGIARQLVV